MARVWQLQAAKNKLSEVVEEAIAHGQQVITMNVQPRFYYLFAAVFAAGLLIALIRDTSLHSG